MNNNKLKNEKLLRRQRRIREKVIGTAERPRLSVNRSNKHVLLQLINDKRGDTICSACSKSVLKGSKTEKSFETGKLIAKIAKEKEIDQVVFDRRGRQYHGRIKAVADGAREGGLIF